MNAVARQGPLVPYRARWGAALAAIASVQFVLAMALTQWKYPGYSDLGNAISDLGNGALSPWSWLFNDSIRVLGVLAIVAIYFVREAFQQRKSTTLGVLFVMVAGAGAFGVGTFPEGSPELGGGIHSLVSLITFLGSGLGLLAFSFAMLRDTRWDGYRAYTALSGFITLIALVLYATNIYPGIGPGGMERLIVAPILLWAVVIGVHLLRMRPFDPSAPTAPSPWS